MYRFLLLVDSIEPNGDENGTVDGILEPNWRRIGNFLKVGNMLIRQTSGDEVYVSVTIPLSYHAQL